MIMIQILHTSIYLATHLCKPGTTIMNTSTLDLFIVTQEEEYIGSYY